MPVLVDTSVWSLLFRRDERNLNDSQVQAASALRSLISERRVRVIGPIRQELLSGIKTSEQFERLQHRFRDFEDEPLTTADYEFAARISYECRKAGISTNAIDALICSAAKLRDWEIFTFDEDFKRYAKIADLRLYQPT